MKPDSHNGPVIGPCRTCAALLSDGRCHRHPPRSGAQFVHAEFPQVKSGALGCFEFIVKATKPVAGFQLAAARNG